MTVTVGIETLGSVCGAACGASGAACGPCEAGASDAGGVVVGGVSDGVGGVCDDAAPAKQSATSAELLRRSKRLVEIDMTPPRPHGKQPRHPTSMHHGESTPCGVSARPSLARGSAGTRSMSGSGRCARRKERALGFGEVERDGRLGPQAAETAGSGKDGGSAKTNAPARWIRVQIGQRWSARSSRPAGSAGALRASLDASALATANLSAVRQREAIEMHVPERQGELECERKQRQIRTPSRP